MGSFGIGAASGGAGESVGCAGRIGVDGGAGATSGFGVASQADPFLGGGVGSTLGGGGLGAASC